MPALVITCPTCQAILQTDESSRGQAVRCPECQTVFNVPGTPPPGMPPLPPNTIQRIVLASVVRPGTRRSRERTPRRSGKWILVTGVAAAVIVLCGGTAWVAVWGMRAFVDAASHALAPTTSPTAPSGNAPAAPPVPVMPSRKDIRELGASWVRNNNAFGPADKIVTDASQRLNEQVGPNEGFVATFGAQLVKSRRPTMLVGWNGEVFPLELTNMLAKRANFQDDLMVVMQVPAADDLGLTQQLGRLSVLAFDRANVLDDAARMTGTVQFNRSRPNAIGASYTLRLAILWSKARITVLQDLADDALPKGDGPIALDFPPLRDRELPVSGVIPVLVELVAYPGPDRQGKPFVVSNAAAGLIVPSVADAGDRSK